MIKRYTDYLDDISESELYEGLLAYGLFAEKLPPVFTAEDFYNYALEMNHKFGGKNCGYIYFESMRDINIPRMIGVPNPMAYQRLCECLSNNWEEIKEHFHKQTDKDGHKISRIHIRKMKGTPALFKMNYKNWKIDDSPIPDLLIGKRYMVTADISTCFPSMYSHSICWALVGKEKAKQNKMNKSMWYNKIDQYCMALKNGETHGFLIGPHASNLISEIVLTVVDYELSPNWDYIRNIDDYTCYVETYADAQRFITDLSSQLRKFDLILNHNKTKIEELPVASTKHWVRQLSAFDFSSAYRKVNYKKVQAFLDIAVGLMYENGNNAAIINYAIKVLASMTLTNNAKQYCLKTLLHFAVIYPYLIPLLEEYVIKPFDAEKDIIEDFTQKIYSNALLQENYEAMSYSIYYSLKYNFSIVQLKCEDAIRMDSCLFKLFVWLYYKRRNDQDALRKLKEHAKELSKEEFDQYWIFVYEVLPTDDLDDGDWKSIKKAGVSFIKPEFK